jgi:diguanylate cyclase (GGDEF)-like protein
METIRLGDFVGRWRFGDEFILLLPDMRAEDAILVADRSRASLESISRDWLFPVTVSAGVVEFPVHGNTMDELVQRAEGR